MTRKPISRIIAVVQVLGGIAGAALCAGLVFSGDGGGASLFGLMFLGLYALSVAAGVMLWRGRMSGWILSMVVQALQVLQIESPRFVWRFVSGIAGWLGWSSDGVRIDYDLASRFELSLASGFAPRFDDSTLHIGFNVIAAVALLYLLLARPRGREGR